MTAALRRAGLSLFGVAAIAIVVWNIVPAGSAPNPSDGPFPMPLTSVGIVEPTQPSGSSPQTREYAIALDELQGFPPDVPSGTIVELWVTWDRPSKPLPELHTLVPEAEFVRTIDPTTTGGPTAVVVRVPTRRVPDLLWADAYGTLSATIVQGE